MNERVGRLACRALCTPPLCPSPHPFPRSATNAEELGAALAKAFAYRWFLPDRYHVESIADRVPPFYSWLAQRGKDPLSIEANEARYVERSQKR
ncbi:hypothetical protein [Bosea sp. Tri-44]|uniref:hypothetical protein n=1 Tax=Bosea sp. Tri-44 TaxID=1972137 RepID=UPI0019D6FAD3|nr:hypothetical protein [Bosea sp. Tri-44]